MIAASLDSVSSQIVENVIGTIRAPSVVQNWQVKRFDLILWMLSDLAHLLFAFPRSVFHCICRQAFQTDMFHCNQTIHPIMQLTSGMEWKQSVKTLNEILFSCTFPSGG